MRRVCLALILSGLFLSVARAEDPVHFSDPKLKAAVEAELWVTDPTPTDMLGLTSLRIPLTWQQIGAISDLTGLDYATNLAELNLRYHKVSDLSPLSYLVHLKSLNLFGNGIVNISPLSDLVELESLDLELNEISDISALSSLTSLSSVCLHHNYVSDISPLTSLTSLDWVDLRACPLGTDAFETYIPEIKANNPGVTILYDGFFEGQLVITCSIGGTVVSPGEGTFTVAFNETLCLEVEADPGFAFAGWSGTCTTDENPFYLTMDQNHTLRANFVSVLGTICVDGNAPNDPGPRDSAVSDSCENGTSEHPFDRIQEAIEVADKGAAIVVQAGTYHETIDLLGKQIRVTGFDPNDPNQAFWPVLDGGGNGPVVSFSHGEDSRCHVTGFVVTGGKDRSGAAIRCTGSSPTIANCLIVGNRATEWNGAAILCMDSHAVFTNCTIADNRAGQFGAALSAVNGQVTVANSILWGNWPKEIDYEGDLLPSVRYCTVASGWLGQGNINADPLFAAAGRWARRDSSGETVRADDPEAVWIMGDYHLQSQAGRWDPRIGTWQQDSVTSPCIDAGDPATPVGFESSPNGGIVDLGVYGGTMEASHSISRSPAP